MGQQVSQAACHALSKRWTANGVHLSRTLRSMKQLNTVTILTCKSVTIVYHLLYLFFRVYK